MGFGRELQKQRMARKIELEAISSGTKVSIRHLRALEEEDRTELPGGVFNKGILRSYCRFVGLEEASWMERFADSPLAVAAEANWEEFAENVRRNRPAHSLRQERRWGGVALMIAALAVLAWMAWQFTVRPRVLAPQANPTTVDAPVDSSAGSAAPDNIASASPADHRAR